MQKEIYEKIKDQLEERILSYASYEDINLIRQSVLSLFRLKDSKRLEPFIEAVEKIKHTSEKNKTLIELYGIILLEARRSFSSYLSDDAIILFAHYYRNYELMDQDIEECNRQALEESCKKTKDIQKREAYYDIAMNLSKTDNKNPAEVIKNMSEEDYNKLYDKYESGESLQRMVNEEKNNELGQSLRRVNLL